MEGLDQDQVLLGGGMRSLTAVVISMKLSACDLVCCNSKFCIEKWQNIIRNSCANKFRAIHPLLANPVIGNTPHVVTVKLSLTDWRLVILAWHTLISYTVSIRPTNMRYFWHSIYSEAYGLLDCRTFRTSSRSTSLPLFERHIFESLSDQNVIEFIKGTHFYHQL